MNCCHSDKITEYHCNKLVFGNPSQQVNMSSGDWRFFFVVIHFFAIFCSFVPPICLPKCPFTYSSATVFDRSFIADFIHSFKRAFVRSFSFLLSSVPDLFNCSSVCRPFIHSSIHLLIHSSINPSTHPFIRSSARSFLHPFINYSLIYFIRLCLFNLFRFLSFFLCIWGTV